MLMTSTRNKYSPYPPVELGSVGSEARNEPRKVALFHCTQHRDALRLCHAVQRHAADHAQVAVGRGRRAQQRKHRGFGGVKQPGRLAQQGIGLGCMKQGQNSDSVHTCTDSWGLTSPWQRVAQVVASQVATAMSTDATSKSASETVLLEPCVRSTSFHVKATRPRKGLLALRSELTCWARTWARPSVEVRTWTLEKSMERSDTLDR